MSSEDSRNREGVCVVRFVFNRKGNVAAIWNQACGSLF